VKEFAGRKPKKFDIFVPGVVSEGRRDVALTFDACGGGKLGNGFDAKLIGLLEKHEVAATLFLNGRWIDANPSIAADLAANPLFELANHGWEHRPLTVAGQAAYGIKGTANPGEAYDEIMRGVDALAQVTGERSPYFRPGTAWCDDVAVELAGRLGVSIIAFSINGDAGATAPKATVAANFGKARSRSIVLAHFNRPEKATAEGLAKALPRLLDAGRSFATLTDALA
jgi:peptidoglycan/xylan/chitin deacetylase (PgdA/CDA1 family)